MKKIPQFAQNGLTSYQIKIIAMVFMTIDHIGAYGFEIPCINDNYSLFRILGRIAAPLFLYMLTESVRYTHSKFALILRLYIGAILTNFVVVLSNYFLGEIIGYARQSNILFTFFYIACYIVVIELLISKVKARMWGTCAGIIFLTAASTYVLHIGTIYIREHVPDGQFTFDLIQCLIESPINVEYTPIFAWLGILLYFIKNKTLKLFVFSIFSFASYSYLLSELLFFTPLISYFGYPQYWMILALPFMALYNGNRGKERKLLFYLYYPSHIVLLRIIVAIAR